MSPEYAMEGLFSVKSDVYSFGILVLEIITSRKNTGYYHEEYPNSNLVGHVRLITTSLFANNYICHKFIFSPHHLAH